MSVEKLYLMRGLYVPECNFIHGLDGWTFKPTDWSGDAEIVGASMLDTGSGEDPGGYLWGTGSSLAIDVTGRNSAFSDYFESPATAYGVGAGPYGSYSAMTMRFWVGAIVKTYNITEGSQGSTGMLKLCMQGYNEDGNTTDLLQSTAVCGYQPTWTLVSGWINASPLTATTRYWKMRIYVDQCAAGAAGTRLVFVDWAGAAIPFSATPANEQISTWYHHRVTHEHTDMDKWMSPRGRAYPLIRNEGSGEKATSLALNFAYLPHADKQLVQAVYHWNTITPTSAALPWSYPRLVNRGTKAPAMVILNRANIKRAFYADMVGGRRGFTQGVQGSYLETTVWQAPLYFTEWV